MPTIRSCLKSDMLTITAIYAHNVRYGTASFETQPPAPEEMGRRRSDVLAKGVPYFVAVSGGDVVGYTYAGTYRPRPAWRDTVESSIYVHPECVGKRLLPTLIAECEARDPRQTIAMVGDSANLASIRLHVGRGFQTIGVPRSVGCKFGRWLDAVPPQRSHGPGNSVPTGHP